MWKYLRVFQKLLEVEIEDFWIVQTVSKLSALEWFPQATVLRVSLLMLPAVTALEWHNWRQISEPSHSYPESHGKSMARHWIQKSRQHHRWAPTHPCFSWAWETHWVLICPRNLKANVAILKMSTAPGYNVGTNRLDAMETKIYLI